MQKKLIARTAKLQSESRKSKRHPGVAVAYEHIPKDIDERKHGAIYAVVNVKAPADMAEEVGTLIVDTFHGEYYQDLGRDPEASFVAVLARINEELAEITHHGNTAWLGNLHAVLAIISNDTIHLTRTGKAEAHLYRSGRAWDASQGIEGDNINPLRTFAYTGSTELLEGDKIAIVTPGVFSHVSKQELQKYVEEYQPKVAISHLADLLEDKSGEVHPNSILALEIITPEAASEETVPELEEEIWIADKPRPMQDAIDASTPFIKKAYIYLHRAIAAVAGYVTATAWPKIKEWSLDAVDIAKNITKKDSVLVETQEAIVSDGGKINIEDLTINESTNELVEEVKTSPNSIYIKETARGPKLLHIDLSSARGMAGKLNGLIRKMSKNRKPVLIAAVALVVVLGLGVFGFWKARENAETARLAEASLTEATTQYDISQTQIAAGDSATAATSLRSALVIAESLSKDKKLGPQANNLSTKIRAALDTAEGVVRVDAQMLADASQIVGNDTLGPYLVGNSLYLISKTDASIAAISTNGGEASRVLDKPRIDGRITSAAAVSVRSVLVFMTDAGKIYEFDTKDVKLNQQTVAGEFEQSSALAAFSTNIYSLDSTTGKIYKRLKGGAGYGARSEYIVDGTTVPGATSLTIDSSVYTTLTNGEMARYLGGKKQAFSLSQVPMTMSQVSAVFTDENTASLYELEGAASRVIRLDKQGVFQNQYVAENYKNASGIYMDDAAKVLYVVSGGKIYKTAI